MGLFVWMFEKNEFELFKITLGDFKFNAYKGRTGATRCRVIDCESHEDPRPHLNSWKFI